MTPVTLYEAKHRPSITIKDFLFAAQHFNWATRKQYLVWFHGGEARDNGRVERVLKRLSESKKLRRVWYDGRFVYSCNRLNRKKQDQYARFIFHGLGITEGFIRLWKADSQPKTYLYENDFTFQRPEFGITYSTGKSLLYEFCTFDNMDYLKNKIRRYEQVLLPDQVVLFVCDYDKELLKRRVITYQPKGSFFFVDYDSFKSVPIREQLTAKIYFIPTGEVEALRDVQH